MSEGMFVESKMIRANFLGLCFVSLAFNLAGLGVVLSPGQAALATGDWALFLRLGVLLLTAGFLVVGRFGGPSLGKIRGLTAALFAANLIEATAITGLTGGNLLTNQVSFLGESVLFLVACTLFSDLPWLVVATSATLAAFGIVFFGPGAGERSPLVLNQEQVASYQSYVLIFVLPLVALVVGLVQRQTRRLVSTSRRATDALAKIAFRDADTGLPNGPALERDLEAWQAETTSSGRVLILAAFRLDGLDSLNALHGLEFTTQVVRRVTARWVQTLDSLFPHTGTPEDRRLQTLYRVESNVFLFPALQPPDDRGDRDEVRHLLAALLVEEAVADPRSAGLGFQGGFARYPNDGGTPPLLVRRVLNLLYSRPPAAVGDFLPLVPGDYSQFVRREGLRVGLAAAIGGPEVTVVFQPKVRLNDRTVSGFEALSRWDSPQWGIVGPSEFVPIAEEFGLIEPLTRLVLAAASAMVATLRRQNALGFRVSVNLSPRLLEGSFLGSVSAEPGFDLWAPYLEFEITEGSAMVLTPAVRESIRALRALGVAFSVDDFGTGYSNLASLQEFDAQVLKIDKRFVDGIPEDPKNVSLVGAIAQMARAFGMEVVAEGVETQAQWETLTALGCHQIQGYLASRPVPAAEAAAFRFSEGRPALPQSPAP